MSRFRYRMVMLLWCGLLLAPVAAAGTEWRSVAVREGALRREPMPFGQVLALLPYGERVELVAEQGAWFKVRTGEREGWMHGGGLVVGRIKLQAGKEVEAAASRDEVALGGKGFSPEVEASYRAGRTDVDYPAVDRMERSAVSVGELRRFLAQGKLNTGAEGDSHAQ